MRTGLSNNFEGCIRGRDPKAYAVTQGGGGRCILCHPGIPHRCHSMIFDFAEHHGCLYTPQCTLTEQPPANASRRPRGPGPARPVLAARAWEVSANEAIDRKTTDPLSAEAIDR